MLTFNVSVTVDIPQLDALRQTLEQLGVQLMADFNGLREILSQVNSTFDQHLSEIEALLASDSLDQQQIDEVVTQLRTFQTRLADAIPEVQPPPPPTP